MQAVLFDTFGTVVDWRSGVAAAVSELSTVVDPAAFADAWRARYQPSMEPIRAGRRPFVRLTDLHRENLAATLAAFGWDLGGAEVEWLNRAWERLPAWPDSVEGLRRLKDRHLIGPLSNGDTALLVRMAKHAGLPWDVVLGSDVTRRYKPHPEAYTRAAAFLDLPPAEVMLVAAHNDDLVAARAAGLATGFVARPAEHGPGQRQDLVATADWDVAATDLGQLADLI
ncbi:MAG TPA: haloacid dehalogenase type II [Mycobacteriales bacterium]|nr:haloacid dehalogenase type II [Mycobacteriales bacterium]